MSQSCQRSCRYKLGKQVSSTWDSAAARHLAGGQLASQYLPVSPTNWGPETCSWPLSFGCFALSSSYEKLLIFFFSSGLKCLSNNYKSIDIDDALVLLGFLTGNPRSFVVKSATLDCVSFWVDLLDLALKAKIDLYAGEAIY